MGANEVRNVLMNEMGLTRESIREETSRIVEKTVERFLSHLMESDQLGSILLRAANKELRAHDRYAKTMSGYVEDGARAAAKEWIAGNIEIRTRKA